MNKTILGGFRSHRGTPKSSISIGFSIKIPSIVGYLHFRKPPYQHQTSGNPFGTGSARRLTTASAVALRRQLGTWGADFYGHLKVPGAHVNCSDPHIYIYILYIRMYIYNYLLYYICIYICKISVFCCYIALFMSTCLHQKTPSVVKP